ncbi:MAG: holo-ACP synthase [Elusimicrobiaceae bacterium]|nr:holo-ACP synthase [Elusimicrobiaceae bacterium]MBQ6224612.1 holo-ACP synthase [Campylobacter sp.]
MQIVNIGTDIEEVLRFENLEIKTLHRLFTEKELAYCLNSKNKAQHLAVRFAAKEAVFKALPFEEIALKKIEVVGKQGQKPQIAVYDERAKNLIFKLSLSHTKNNAVAFVVVLKEDNA